MTVWIIISVVLLAIVIYLLYRLGARARQLASAIRDQEREWTLKVALEKTFSLPDVDANELAPIEPQLQSLMKGGAGNEETEEQIRQTVMELYAQKAEKAIKKEEK
jgi:hypothetical protein